jgi:4-aminobutyrate aminotransferase/(S)-3-amino-2-methylpropionate transaminase
MPSNADLQARRARAVPRAIASSLAIHAASARDSEVWDVEGRRFIDFASGISVLNTGHSHPRVTDAVARQLAHMTHAMFQVTPYESYIALAERINAVAPFGTERKTLFMTTGAEAVENAIKIARFHTGRTAIVAFAGGFHGRTHACLSLTGKIHPYKAGFGAMLPEIFHIPFPVAYHNVTIDDSMRALELLFRSSVDPARVAAIIVEPVLGEGGFYPAPPELLRRLRSVCNRHGILMIVDEIQTGYGRTGKMFAIEHAGVEPDLMTLAKSIAGGLPLSAVVGKAIIMDAPGAGGLGGTYAGSPLACAAGLAVLDIIRDEDLVERSARIGGWMLARLQQMQARYPCIGAVRGLGAMVAMELVKNRRADQPDADLTKALVQAAGRRGLIILSCGTGANVIRFLTPLTIPDAVLEEGFGLLEQALGEVSGSLG